MRSIACAIAVVACVAASAGRAAADKADALFKKGKKLLAEKHYADACAAFEDSDRLEPGIGAKLNVGKCYEEWGKLALAYRWYSDAEKMAADAKDERVAKIHARAEELDGSVPRLTVRVPAGAVVEGAAITIDGKRVDAAVLGTEQRVDPGPHVIEYEVNGAKKTKIVPVERGGSSEVTLDLPRGEPAHAEPAHPAPSEPAHLARDLGREPVDEHPGRGRRIAGVVVGSAGVIALGVAGYVTLHARSRYRDALAADCNGDKTMCDMDGLTLTANARHQANIATVVTIVGAVAVAGGIVLYLTAPRPRSREHALYLRPELRPDREARTAGLVLGGSF